MSNLLDNFYQNYPLTFLGRDPEKQQLTNLPNSLRDSKNSILNNDWDRCEKEETRLGIQCAQQIYLFATGNYDYTTQINGEPGEEIESLIKSGRINDHTFGFIHEISHKSRSNAVRLKPEDVDKVSNHKLTQFCYAQGMFPGHDTETHELRSMASWVIKNSRDGVNFSHFSTMMQQAIDLSVFAQHINLLNHDQNSSKSLREFSQNGISQTQKIQKQQNELLTEAGTLLNYATESIDRMNISDFQAKVLKYHLQYQAETPDKEILDS